MLNCLEFVDFEETIEGKYIAHRCKDVDAVLRKFLMDCQLFDDYGKIKFICLALGRDYDKGSFTILLTMYLEMENRDEPCHIDEAFGEIDSTEEKYKFFVH